MKPRLSLAAQWFNQFSCGSGLVCGPGAAGLLFVCLPSAIIAAEPTARPRAHLQSVAELVAAPASARGIGVSLSRATVVLRRQLGLQRGAGLVAEEVAAGSAAARAGFIQHDVLVRLDDQILLLPEQFDALLESAEPADPLACTVLRGGREVIISLGQPGTAQPPVAAEPGSQPFGGARHPAGLRPTASSLAIIAPVSPRQTDSRGWLQQLSEETLVRQDADYQIRLSRGDETHLVVADPAGRVIFQGSIDSQPDRERMPEAVRGRVAEMEKLLEPRQTASESHVVPASAVAEPAITNPATRIGRLDIQPVELR